MTPTADERHKPKLVLAVDDQDLNLELLAAYLNGEGCELVTARSGVEALEIVSQRRPDLVLLDVMMPGIDGFEICRRIKLEPANRLLPVVLVSALHEVEHRVHGLEVGADDFLTKPLDRNEVIARVLTLLRAKEFNDHLDDAEHVMLALAKAVEAKDSGTICHVERVAHNARALGQAAGLTGATLDNLYFGGVVHDIGKIGVPDAILQKPGPLDSGEIKLMRRHVLIGVEIARPLRSAAGVVPIIKHHHENFDGFGYPDALKGDAIPLVARIVAACDAYDAMVSERPYRKAMPPAAAAAVLRSGAGKQWDPDLVKRFLGTVLPEQERALGLAASGSGPAPVQHVAVTRVGDYVATGVRILP
jgi:putative two-component system response regulator